MANADIIRNIDTLISALNNKADTNLGNSAKASEIASIAASAASAASSANTVAQAANTLINTALPQKADIDDVLLNTGGSVNGNVTVNGDLSVTGTINATIQGTTSNATKAIQDGDGNVITSTYLKKTDKAANATSAESIIKYSVPDGTYHDAIVVTSSADSSKRVGTIRFNNNDGSNSIVIGAHDESNSAPAGLTITNTNGTLTSTLPGTFTSNTFKGSLVGNADTATNATQAELAAKATADASGNTITSTYATKTELTNGLSGKANSEHGTHVTFTTTTPKANGTAAVGSATTVSRSDHVHPLQTTVSGSSGSCTGNAATATKLAAAKTIAISGGATGTATSFDGSGNITIPVTALDMSKASAGTLAVARGGTGLTASPSMLVNLASTTAANVLAASPRPGVTGVLPIANGGTGSSTKNFVDLSSAQTIAGTKTFTNTVKASLGEFANFVATNGGYGFQIRNDGESTWFLLTDKNNENGQWSNTLQYGHPIRIVNSTGEVYINNQSLTGKASITTTSLGQSWYRVYSDGWIEQGGYAKSGGSTSTAFTFPKAFTTAIRTIHLEPNCTGGEYWNAEIRIVASSLTSFNVQSVQAHSVGSWAFNFYWYAAGY